MSESMNSYPTVTPYLVVSDADAQTFAGHVQADLIGDLTEPALPIVVVDQRLNWGEFIGMAVGAVTLAMLPTPDVREVPFHVAENDQIQQAIVVQIDPGGGG